MSSTARPSVVVRCDAGPTYGIGHVMRCVALGEEFAARGWGVTVVADLDAVPWAKDQVLRRGFLAEQPPGAEDAEVRALLARDPDLVVIDSYLLPEQVYAGLRAGTAPTIALVDGDPSGRPADLWLDQNIGAENDPWPVPEGTVRLAGLRFALMRDEVRSARPDGPRASEGDTPRVLAFFGGTDAYGAAPVVLAQLAQTGLPFRATVVAPRPELVELCHAVTLHPGQSVDLVGPVGDLSARVAEADLVLSAAGTSSWELLCLGAAAGLVCVADNQATSYERAVAAGLVVGLGYLEALRSSPSSAFAKLLGSVSVRTGLRERGWHEVDGRGRERVADACVSLMAPDET